MKKIFPLLSVCIWMLISCNSYQKLVDSYVPEFSINRFESTIQQYEKEDTEQGTPTNHILFYGSSSWRKWENIKADLAPLPIVNRGFGGSTLTELNHFADRMIFKYQPKAIVIYCGENDLAEKKKKTPEQVLASYHVLVQKIKSKLPTVSFYFVSMKKSPSRRHLWNEIDKGNKLVKKYSDKNKLHYIDINPLLFDANGQVKSELYTGDSLHINQHGYDAYAKLLKPILSKI